MAAWELSAVCRQVDPDLWFPKPGENGRAAKRICRERCPVREECLDDAMAREAGKRPEYRHGIRGALSPFERWRREKDQSIPQPQPAG